MFSFKCSIMIINRLKLQAKPYGLMQNGFFLVDINVLVNSFFAVQRLLDSSESDILRLLISLFCILPQKGSVGDFDKCFIEIWTN